MNSNRFTTAAHRYRRDAMPWRLEQRKHENAARMEWEKYEFFDLINDRDSAETAGDLYSEEVTRADVCEQRAELLEQLADALERAGDLYQAIFVEEGEC